MTHRKLILHHAYERDSAVDLSENGNHGLLTDVSPTGSRFRFSGGDSRIDVPANPTFTDMRALHVRVVFEWDPADPEAHRHNLIEGHLSFALFVNPDSSIQATIFSPPTQQWNEVMSAPGVIVPGHEHVVDFLHDGVSHARLVLDGNLVDERWSVPGPVMDIGYYGLTIGHWPDPPDIYTLEGWIDDVRIWVQNPRDEGGGFLDWCCLDRGRLDGRGLVGSEFVGTPEEAWKDLRSLLDPGTAAAVLMRREGESVEAVQTLVQQVVGSISGRDRSALEAAFADLEGLVRHTRDSEGIVELGQRIFDTFASTRAGRHLIRDGEIDGRALRRLVDIARALCLDWAVPPTLIAELPPKTERPEPRTDGDPRTDGPAPQGLGPSDREPAVVPAPAGTVEPVPPDPVPPEGTGGDPMAAPDDPDGIPLDGNDG